MGLGWAGLGIAEPMANTELLQPTSPWLTCHGRPRQVMVQIQHDKSLTKILKPRASRPNHCGLNTLRRGLHHRCVISRHNLGLRSFMLSLSQRYEPFGASGTGDVGS